MGQRRKEIIVPTPRQVSSGKWYIYLRLSTGTYSITDKDYNRCIARARAIKAGVLEEETTDKLSRKTLSDAIDDYIMSRSSILSPSTIRGYRIIQKNRFQGIMGKDINSITQQQLQAAVNIDSKNVSAKTIVNSFRFIQSVISETTGRKYNISLPQIIPNERPYLTPEQIQVFLKAIYGSPYELAALLGLWSCRRSEILAITYDDIDMKNNVIHIRGARVQNEKGEWIDKATNKNTSSRRDIPLAPRIKELVENSTDKTGRVVKWCASAIAENINRICANNDLPKIGIHGLRHSFASLGYSLDIPEKELMKIGGWSNDATMKKIYTHISKQQEQTAMQKMMEFYTEKAQN